MHVSLAKQNGRWADAYVASEMEVPVDFLEALDGIPAAKDTFGKLKSAERYRELLRAGKGP
jgi:uncharacterized protein YdeI (YjbR/CyaY-like superfamily)